MRLLFLTLCVLVTACGPTEAEKERIAQVTCAIIAETRNMDAAQRVERVNEVREELGLGPFLSGDDAIIQAVRHEVCVLLVLDRGWENELKKRQEALEAELAELARLEAERLAALEAERAERAAEQARRGAERLAALAREEAERKAEQKRLEAERKAEQKRLEAERKAEQKRLEAEALAALRQAVAKRGYAIHTEVEIRGGVTYLKGDNSAFFGTVNTYKQDGKLAFRQSYENGRRHGLFESFYADGTIQDRANYENGKLVWLKSFDSKGTLVLGSRD